ncbi:hypothetical protein AAFP35_22210 [Gordonia sp. CPCC 206044]|uniref:hypothetical protein n=1 Tax=Gordonia sp. CPCC 206044 TaxID=3140793 RepID=UPI003AF3D855
MPGYGYPPRRPAHLWAAAAIVTLLAAAVTACSLDTDTKPSQIVLPPTDVLSTQSETESISSTTSEIDDADTPVTALPNWTIGRIVALAPRVENSRYHQGSTSPESPLMDTSGFHFSTPDRAVNCSTAPNGETTLACRLNSETRGSPPSGTSSACRWTRNLVTLSTDGPHHGACENRYPVLYRSTIVGYGNTISVSRFSCLVEAAGLFCLESRSKSGFSVTSTGYSPIEASDRAPAELLGMTDSTGSEASALPTSPEIETTTPAVPTS